MRRIDGGFILISRKITMSQIFNKPPLYLKVWIYLLISAQHGDYHGLKRGQVRTTINEIQEACSWYSGFIKKTPTRDEIFNILEFLRSNGADNVGNNSEDNVSTVMVTTTRATHAIIINIMNYDFYQDFKNYADNTENTDATSMRAIWDPISASNQYKQRTKSIKKHKQEEENDTFNHKVGTEVSDNEYIEVSKYLFGKVKEHMQGVHEPSYKQWAKYIDQLIRLDGFTMQDIYNVINWVFVDPFWCTNIRSAGKLREKFPTLKGQMERVGKQKNKNSREDIMPSHQNSVAGKEIIYLDPNDKD